MKNVLKKGAALLLMLLLMPALFCPSALLLAPGEDFYVADYAGLLSDSTKQTVIGANGALETLTGGQIVVATVKDLEGFSAAEFGNRLFDEWGVGNYSRDNGMLLLICPEEGATLIRGAGIADDFDEDTAAEYLNTYFRDAYHDGSYDSAVSELFTQLIGWYELHYGVSILNVNAGEVEKGGGFARFAVVFSVIVLALLVVVLAVVIAMWVDRNRYRRYYYGIGVPMPRYKPYFFFFGGPHRPRHYRRGDGRDHAYHPEQTIYHNKGAGMRRK